MTLAHIQRGVKHDTVTQYWANVNNSPVLGQRLVFDSLLDRRGERTDTKLIGRTNERWEVKQYVSTFIEGRHNYIIFFRHIALGHLL